MIFQGFVPRKDLVQYYSRARLFVQPSISETLPLALLEALACGTPAVATDVGLLGEYFHQAESVRLVPAGSPEALAEGIVQALGATGPGRSDRARELMETRHDWRVIAERWRTVYEVAQSAQ